jgi:hypothetical protein
MPLREYKRRSNTTVFAIRLDVDTDGFDYYKWGDKQRCKRGDWIVSNDGDTYTVDADVFASTYERIGPAEFRKKGTVWAEQASQAGSIQTKEGRTHYEAGDYVVYNDRELTDGYAVASVKFEEMYEPLTNQTAGTD